MSLRNMSFAVTTNGDWFGSIFKDGIELFRVDKNGQVHDSSIIDTTTAYFMAKLHEDGSLMVAFADYILTYEYVNSQWVVTQNSSFPGAEFFVYSIFSAGVQDNALILFNNKQNPDNATYNIYIITRQADKSWKIIETVAVNDSFISQARAFYWDGANTLICTILMTAQGPPFGAVVVFNKVNGEWQLSQWFSATSVGVTAIGYFGLGPLVALDNNNVLVPAPGDGVSSGLILQPNTGSVYLMQRNQQNEWSFIAKFKSSSAVFSAGLSKNDKDVLILGCAVNDTFLCSLYTVPACVIEPIDFTCPQQRDSCSTDLDNLVTVNNPSCGQVATSYSHITTNKNGITVDVTLSRPLVADAKCSVTLTCNELASVSSGHVLVSSLVFISALTAFLVI